MSTSELCTNERRRSDVRESELVGMDYLEVSHDQLVLTVYFLGKAPAQLKPQNVRIEGGQRIRNIQVLNVQVPPIKDARLDSYMEVTVNKAGDFSTYTLRLVELAGTDARGGPIYQRLSGTDPRYAQLDFTFKVGCPSPLDCTAQPTCPPATYDEPAINYLAKDYSSFRQVLLDRLAITLPDWQEKHVPDIGVALVELMAYAGDYLSYYQDAVSTEAYLHTARQRISVRRHVRLVDYHMHEGCNARAWVVIKASDDLVDSSLSLNDVYFITGYNDSLALDSPMLSGDAVKMLPSGTYEVFEPLAADTQQPLRLYQHHNAIWFYTWGDTGCCLPRGATSATLQDYPHDLNAEQEYILQELQEDETGEPGGNGKASSQVRRQSTSSSSPSQQDRILNNLNPGDFLFFEEVKGAKTGVPEDANPQRRQMVRLTSVVRDVDELYGKNIVQIEWAQEDALQFPFCISAIGPASEGCQLIENISVARGNVLLVDHGQTIVAEQLGSVPVATTTAYCQGEGLPSDVQVLAGPFGPVLQYRPLTYSQPLATGMVPAAQLLNQDVRKAAPWVTLTSIPPEITPGDDSSQNSRTWLPVYDLLDSQPLDTSFVVEIDNDGYAHLRFGDDELGRAPDPDETFAARYRTGNGTAGNVGAEAISRIVFRKEPPVGLALTPRNPFPATGGTAQEPVAEVKLFAPKAFLTELQRAITPDDYAQLAEKHPGVQRAAAAFVWNGSFYDVVVAIDPLGTDDADPALLEDVALYLEPFRQVGFDLTVVQAEYVSLELSMQVCVLPNYLRGHVEAALLDAFSNHLLPTGKLGFFHPDNLTFGQGIAVSTLVATAQAVTGVQSVVVKTLQRYGEGPNEELHKGLLAIGPMEVARLDNDPTFPEHGILTFEMGGGR